MKEEKTEYSLPFVNKGKKFTLTNWSVAKHKDVLRETKKYEDKLDEKELDEKYRYLLILRGLHEVDSSVTEADLETLHPDDLLEIFAAVYRQGKKGVIVKPNFRKGQTTQRNLKK
jgi:hypothetical protein